MGEDDKVLLLEYLFGENVPQSCGINSKTAQQGASHRLLTWRFDSALGLHPGQGAAGELQGG